MFFNFYFKSIIFYSMDLSSLLWKSLRRKDPPTETSIISVDVPRKPKFISHDSAVNLIKREKDLLRALDIFKRVSSQRGFSHNNSIYTIILHKLGQCKKFEAIDVVLHQMTYETCKFHEGIFLNLVTHFSKSSLQERVLEMFNAIQPIVRENSLKAINTQKERGCRLCRRSFVLMLFSCSGL